MKPPNIRKPVSSYRIQQTAPLIGARYDKSRICFHQLPGRTESPKSHKYTIAKVKRQLQILSFSVAKVIRQPQIQTCPPYSQYQICPPQFQYTSRQSLRKGGNPTHVSMLVKLSNEKYNTAFTYIYRTARYHRPPCCLFWKSRTI